MLQSVRGVVMDGPPKEMMADQYRHLNSQKQEENKEMVNEKSSNHKKKYGILRNGEVRRAVGLQLKTAQLNNPS